jgi:hypothetical protein
MKAVRQDIGDLLAPAVRGKLTDNITALLLTIRAPEKLFNFDLLGKLFAQEIAPSQCVTRFRGRSEYSEGKASKYDSWHDTPPVFCTPALLDRFGLP